MSERRMRVRWVSVVWVGVALSLISIGIPWTLSGEYGWWETIEFGAGWVALALLWWRPRVACTIGAIIWLTAVTDYFAQLALGVRELSREPTLIAGIGTWAVSSSLLLLAAGEVLQRDKQSDRDRR